MGGPDRLEALIISTFTIQVTNSGSRIPLVLPHWFSKGFVVSEPVAAERLACEDGPFLVHLGAATHYESHNKACKSFRSVVSYFTFPFLQRDYVGILEQLYIALLTASPILPKYEIAMPVKS